MKFLVVAAVLLLAVANVLCDEKYTTKYDNLDLDEILNNQRLFNKYRDCILDKGTCTPDGTELKSHIQEALQTSCAKCTEPQKNGVRKVIKFLTTSHRDVWDQVKAKYDPEGKYREQYTEYLKKEGIEA